MNEKKKYTARPITLYVSQGGVDSMDLEHLGIEVERIIDVQMSERDAKQLYDMLRIKLNVEVYGAVSFRLKGRLVL